MSQNGLVSGVAALPEADKRLLKLFFAAALGALGLGVLFGASTALARAGFVDLGPLAGYRAMSGHGVTIFFYWLYFAQAGLLLALAAAYGAPRAGFALRPLAASGVALMAAGLAASLYALYGAMPLLYDAPPELAREPSPAVAAFYAGYLALSAGLFCVAAAAVATTLRPLARGESWSVASFASVAWAGLLMVTAIAAFTAFGPSLMWALGLGTMPTNYSTAWHVLFHNMHYLPLMATVLLWYVLIETLTGVKSILGARFSKIVFASYLILVPPTSLYHMFLEPDLAEPVRVVGSLLSLFISVPTVLVFLVIVVSLEAHARAQGAQGLFGWMRMLPWRNPAMSAIGFAAANLALGGALSFVLIQEKLAPLLSDTFFVPGYFHFLTVGTVTLTFLAALVYALPALTGRALGQPGLLRWLPPLATLGLVLFGTAGVTAGYLGVPRRVLDVSYAGDAPAAWGTLMSIVGVGGLLMTVALGLYVLVLALNLLPLKRGAGAAYPEVRWGGEVALDARAWTGPLAIAVLLALMVVFSVGAFELMKALPLEAIGGAAHH
ncbi:MAG TPA: cbb3-type cytochrome c oxidase subunit I [Burkholderiales bacterium]|nr:cbb3-type cytochrome c oxidase subunit I [Burkholderiales bacterium]